MTGTLWGIGTGPGDPELLTIKASRRIAACPVIAYPVADGQTSLARSIVADHIAPDATELPINLPMRARERAPAQQAYDRAAETIAQHLSDGRDAAFLCEGDPLFYGSFMYLQTRMREAFPTRVIPGVISITAACAAANLPLSARSDTVTVITATLPSDTIRHRLTDTEHAVILKIGRHINRVRDILAELDLKATYVEHASRPNERVLPLADAPDPAPYFSLVIASRVTDPYLS